MHRALLSLLLLTALAPAALAQAPSTMSYQGVLTDAGGAFVPDGSYGLTFRLYDVAAGGAALWTEAHPAVTVTQGGFSVVLGLTTPIGLAFDRTYYLGIEVAAEGEMTPRVRLASSPSALGLRLPFTTTQSSGSPLFSIRNSGSGAAIVADGLFDVGSTTRTGRLRLFRNGSTQQVLDAFVGTHGANLNAYTETGDYYSGLEADVQGQGGYFDVYRSAFEPGFSVDGNYNSTTEPRVSVTGSARSAVFDMSASGNASVALPPDAVSAAETLDESGIGFATSLASFSLAGPPETLVSRTITCPSPGYVLAIGSVQANASHVGGTDSWVLFGLSTTSSSTNGRIVTAYLPPSIPTGGHQQSVAVQTVFPVPAGATTIYFQADEIQGSWGVADPILSVVFVPTAYGVVDPSVPVAGDPRPEGRALTASDVAAEQGEARRFHETRLQRELDELKARLDRLQRELGSAQSAERDTK